MANPEHLKILKQGVEVWNEWRMRKNYKPPKLIDLRIQGVEVSNLWMKEGQPDLLGANLISEDLSGADLSGADLRAANLFGAKLIGANLSGANLKAALLYLSDLSGADLTEARMISTDLVGANITGAFLYGTARDNWNIKGIKCDYIYFDKKGKERTPKDRDFRPGEFEELYKALPTFEYYFEKGFTPIDAVVIDQVVQAINKRHPEFHIDIVSFDKRGIPHATFTVLQKEAADLALQKITSAYEKKIKYLEGQKDQANAMLSQFMTKLIEQPKVMTGDKIEIHCGGDASVAKDQANASIVKGDNSSVPGDDNEMKE